MEQVEYLEEYVEEYPNVIPQILNNTDIEEFLPVNEDDSFDLLPVNTNFDEFIEEDPLVKRYRNDFQRNSHAKKNEEMTTFNDQKGTFRHIESADSSTHKESYKNLITYNNQSSNRTESAAKVISCKTIDTSAIRNRSFPFNTIPLTASIHATRKPNLIQVTKTTKFPGQRRPKSLFGSYTKLNLNRSIDSSLNRIVAVKKSGNNLIGKLKQPVLHSTANIFGSFNEKIIKYKKENPGLFPVKEPEIPKAVQKITAKPSLQSVFINKFNRSLNFKEKKCPMYKPNLNVKKFSRYASKSMSSLEMSSELLDKDNSSIIDDEIDGSVVVEEEIVKTNNEDQNDDSDKDSFDGLVETLNEYIDDEVNNDQIAESLDSIDKCDINIIQPQQTIKLDIQPNIIDQGTHYIKLDESPILRKQIKNYGRNKNPLHNESTYESIKTKPVHSNEKTETRNKNEKVDDSNRRNYSEHIKPSIKESRVKIPKKKSETFVTKRVPEVTKDNNELDNNKPIIISDIKLPVKSNISGRRNILNLDISKQEKTSDPEIEKVEYINKNLTETLEEDSSLDENKTILDEICQIEEELNVSEKVEEHSFSQQQILEKNSEITIEYCSENVGEIPLTGEEIHNSNKLEVENDEIQMKTLEIEIENTKIDDKNEDSKIDSNEEVEGILNEEEPIITNGIKKDELSEIVEIVIKDCNKINETRKNISSESVQISESEIQESVLSISENLKQSDILSEVKAPSLTILNDNSNSDMPTLDSIDNEQKEDNLDDVDEIDNILAEIDSVMESIHSDEHKPKGEILNSALSETNEIEPEEEQEREKLNILKELGSVISSTLIENKNREDKNKNDGTNMEENSSQISRQSNSPSSEGFLQTNDNPLNTEDNSLEKLDENLLPELTAKVDVLCKISKDSPKPFDPDKEISKADKSDQESFKVSDPGTEVSKVRKNSKDSSKSNNTTKETFKPEDKDTPKAEESFQSNVFDEKSLNGIKISTSKPNDSDTELSKTKESKENLDKEISIVEQIVKDSYTDSLKLKNSNKEFLKLSDLDKEVSTTTDSIDDSSKVEISGNEYSLEKSDISKGSTKDNDTDKKVSNSEEQLTSKSEKSGKFSPTTKAIRAKFDNITKIAKVVLLRTDKIHIYKKQNIASAQQCTKVQHEGKTNSKTKGTPIQNLSVRTRKQSKDQIDLEKSKSANETKVESEIKTRSRNKNWAKESKIHNTDSKVTKTEIGKTNAKSEVIRPNVKNEKSTKQIKKLSSVSNFEVKITKINTDMKVSTQNIPEVESNMKNEKSVKQIIKKSLIESNVQIKTNKVNPDTEPLIENNSEGKNNKSIKQISKKSSIESNPEEKTNKVNVDTELFRESNPEVKNYKSIKQINKKSSIESNSEEKTNKVNADKELLTENNPEVKNNKSIKQINNKSSIESNAENNPEVKNNKSIKQINKKSSIESNSEEKTNKVNADTELLTENIFEDKNNVNEKSNQHIKKSSIESGLGVKTNKVTADIKMTTENNSEVKNNDKNEKSMKEINKKSSIESSAEEKTNEVNADKEVLTENNTEVKNNIKNDKLNKQTNKKSSSENNPEVNPDTETVLNNATENNDEIKNNDEIDKSIKQVNKKSSLNSNSEVKINELNTNTELLTDNNTEVINNDKNEKSIIQINKNLSLESNSEIQTNKDNTNLELLTENNPEVKNNMKNEKSIKEINKKSSTEITADGKTNKVNADTELLTENNTEVKSSDKNNKSIKQINKKSTLESNPEVQTNEDNIDTELLPENNSEMKNKATIDILENLNNKTEEITNKLQNSEILIKNKGDIEAHLLNVVEPDNNKTIQLENLDNVTTRSKPKEIESKNLSNHKTSPKTNDIEKNDLKDFDNLKEYEKIQKSNLEICTIPLENQKITENTLKSQETKLTVAENSQESIKNLKCLENNDKTILNNEHLKENSKTEKCESSMRTTRLSTSSEIKEKGSDGLSDYEVESIMAKKVDFNKKGDFLIASLKGTRLERKRLLESCHSESSESDKTDTTSIKSPLMELYSKRKRIDSKLKLNTSKNEIDLIKDKTLEQSIAYSANIMDKSNSEKGNASKEKNLNLTVKTYQTRLADKGKEIQKDNLERNQNPNELKERSIELKEINQTHDINTRSKRAKGKDVSQNLTITEIPTYEPPVRKSISLRNKIVQIETRDNSRTKKSENKNKIDEKQNKVENKNTSISSPQSSNILSDFAYPEVLSSTPNESLRITPKRLRRPYNNVNMLASALNESMLIPKSEKRRERRAATKLLTKPENSSKNIIKDAKDMMAPSRPRECARIIRRRQSNLIQISRKEYEKVLRENIFKKEKQNQNKNKNLLKTQGIIKNLKIKLKKLSISTIKKLMQASVKEQKVQSDTILKQPKVKEQKGQNEIILKQLSVKEPQVDIETILKQPNEKEQQEHNETILKHIESPKSTSDDKVVTRKEARQKSLDEIKTLNEKVEVNVKEKRKIKGKKIEESINNSQELGTPTTTDNEREQKEQSETILPHIESPKNTPDDKVVTRKDSRRKSLEEINILKESAEANVKEKRKVKGKRSDENIKSSQESETPTNIDNNESDKQNEDLGNNSMHTRAESTPKENQEEKPQVQNKQPTTLEKPKKGLISIVPLNDRVSRRDTVRKSEEYSKRLTRARSMPRNMANIEKEISGSFMSKNNCRSITHLNRECENDNAVKKGHNIINEILTPTNENNDLGKNEHLLKNKVLSPTSPINDNLDNQVLLNDFQAAVSDQFSVNQNLRLRNRISRGGHKIQSDEKTIESIIMAHIISRENSKESSNSPQNNRKGINIKLKHVPQLSGNKIELEEINMYPQKSVAQSGTVANPTLEKSWLTTNEKKLIENEIELQQEKSKEKILASSSTKSDSLFVSTIVPLDQLKSTKGNVPTINQHLPVNQQSKQNQTQVKTTIIQPPTQVKLLPAHVVVETVFMTREEYDRKNLKKIITPPAPLSLTAQVKQKNQTKLTTSTDSSMSTSVTTSRSNVQNVGHFRDIDSIMNKICDLLELQIKSESRLNLNESEEQRRKIQRFNNISKMKLNSENALQVLIFLQNYFFNVTTPETYAKQQARQQQLLNNTLTSSPSPSEPLSSSSSSTSSSRLELLNSASNDSEKCFSFKRIRLQKQPEQQDNQQNLAQPQKQQKPAQNSKGTNKRSVETSLSDIHSPSKMLRSSEKLFSTTGGIPQKESEEILPDFLNILAPQIKEEVPDDPILT